jgi:hypothetical protein
MTSLLSLMPSSSKRSPELRADTGLQKLLRTPSPE